MDLGSPLACKNNFAFKIKTPFRLYAPGDFVHKVFYVSCAGVSGVDDDIAVPGGYLRAAYAEAPESKFVDDFACGFAKVPVVLKRRTRTGKTVMPFFFPVPAVFFRFRAYGIRFSGAHGKAGG
jgi:hypothetical protein